MTVLLAALATIAIPFLAVSALLRFSERLQDRQEMARERQIELTDAIHWELGAVAAPRRAPSPLRWLARVDGDSAGSSGRGGRGGASDRQALPERDGASRDRAPAGGAERTVRGCRFIGAPFHPPAARGLREEEDSMCFDPYVLERITALRLAELRADAARRLTVQSLHPRPSRLLALLRFVLGKTRVLGRGTARPRHA